MHNINIVKDMLKAGVYNEQLQNIYNCTDSETEFYAKRYIRVIDNFESTFGKKESIALFSAPGRTEIGGNHTDHQHGCVIAGSVNLDVIAAAAPNGTNVVRLSPKVIRWILLNLMNWKSRRMNLKRRRHLFAEL